MLQSSGQPLSKVYIDLRGATWLSTTTEEDGKFYFPNVQPGQYHLYARREGYALAEYGQRWTGGPGQLITLTAGQPVTNVQVGLALTAVISGRISDLNGNPVTGARVRAMKTSIQENRRTSESVFRKRSPTNLASIVCSGWLQAVITSAQLSSHGRSTARWSIIRAPQLGTRQMPGSVRRAAFQGRKRQSPSGPERPMMRSIFRSTFPRSIDGEQAAPIDLQPGMEFSQRRH